MTTEIKETTIHNLVTFAIEQNNMEMLQILIQKKLTNIDECLKEATEKGKSEIIMLLINKHVDAKDAVKEPIKEDIPKKNFRKIVVTSSMVFNSIINATQLMTDCYSDPTKALNDLKNNEVSLEEINYRENSAKWSILHYLCHFIDKIPNVDLLIEELIAKGVDINAESVFSTTPLSLILTNNRNITCKEKIAEVLLNSESLILPLDGNGENICIRVLREHTDMSEKLISLLITRILKDKIDFNINKFISGTDNIKFIQKIMKAYFKYYDSSIIQIKGGYLLTDDQLLMLSKMKTDRLCSVNLFANFNEIKIEKGLMTP